MAMFITYFVSTKATHAIRESHALSQAMLSATSTMEVDIVSGGLRMFQYHESGDPYYREAYRQHSERFRQYVERLQALDQSDDWREIARTVAEYHKALDRVSLDVMANHERMNAETQSVYEQLSQLIGASTRLQESAAPGSAQHALGKKVEAARMQLVLSLMDFLHRDRGDSSVSERISDLRALLEAYGKMPLPQAGRKPLEDFRQAFGAFSTAMDQVLRSMQTKRDDMTKILYLQRQILTVIAARIKPALKRHTDSANTDAANRIKGALFLAGGLSLLLALLAVLAGRYGQRAVIGPIQTLAAGADEIAAGNLNHRVTITSRDEYAELARHFNHMAAQLQGTMVSKSLHEDQASQLRALLDGVQDYAIFSTDDQGRVTRWNAASTRILGYATEDMEGASFARIFKDTTKARSTSDAALAAVASAGRFEINSTLVRKNLDEFEANIVVTRLSADDGVTKGCSFVVRDITERVKAERHIEQLATKDTLTGLVNRSLLMEQIASSIARASRSHTQLVLLFIDLDHFKEVNDTLGHAAGDELLRECAKRLTDCVREGDVVARLGGDEFVVLLVDVADNSIVAPIAERMLQSLTTPYHLQSQDAQTSASIGICFYPGDGSDVTTLMKNADIAMYHAKEMNRNNYQFYAEEMNLRMVQRTQLVRELHAALGNGEFVLHYQPQVNVHSGEIHGVESLIRWQHPTRGLLFPGDFIAVAEETGLIVRIGEWVLNEACRTMHAWRAKGVNIPYVGVNVSAAQLDHDIVSVARQALATHEVEPGWLMLEITETMLMERVDEAIAIFQRIRDLGIRIGMDDFGTGYSSLSVLQRLPLDTLKIDRSFVSAIDDEIDNSRAIAIIGAIIAIAKELNLNVVAEGVETPTQLAFLRTLNCDTYQGYLFSKPVDTQALETRLAAPAPPAPHDTDGHLLTVTSRIMMELPSDSG